jgi:hypothetical protein
VQHPKTTSPSSTETISGTSCGTAVNSVTGMVVLWKKHGQTAGIPHQYRLAFGKLSYDNCAAASMLFHRQLWVTSVRLERLIDDLQKIFNLYSHTRTIGNFKNRQWHYL